ncbi:hypothetical protein CEUSTIGMA_g5761.t1 [Chlamydomonas eustigma]|uniref:Serine aminopeptidase S33 domain-containing protein n=1 Tax=Chlamydomonas eustigma TaxID=1157962 RepID=A0A250X5X5_9CHLO|nr:hypothetical protein CEUSTIGMA_g5761.t1 [Chlamydomonas eustigma]|eukprot:GAX78319.1 hypothetical protein CEUSTIGMA_g5761.t1 [Chlamydomonas eustigma]
MTNKMFSHTSTGIPVMSGIRCHRPLVLHASKLTDSRIRGEGLRIQASGTRDVETASNKQHAGASSGHQQQPSSRSSRPRPLVPVVNLPEFANSLFGEPKFNSQLEAMFNLTERLKDQTPSIYTPGGVARSQAAPDPSTLPLILYLPGIDGTGLAAYRQFPYLSERFDLRALFMPPNDRTPFKDLVLKVKDLLEEQLEGMSHSRPVYLLGESFGGLMALAVAKECPAVDRVVLVNPATSFSDSPWPLFGPALTALPTEVYNTLPIALSPLITNPVAIAMHGVKRDTSVPRQVSDLAYGLIELLPELQIMRLVLPPATLAWRLQLLKEGSTYVNGVLGQVPQRTLLLTGQEDRLIPSASEGPRLKRMMQRCRLKSLSGRSHALLQEAGVNVVRIMDEEGFYIPVRRLSSQPGPPSPPSSSCPESQLDSHVSVEHSNLDHRDLRSLNTPQGDKHGSNEGRLTLSIIPADPHVNNGSVTNSLLSASSGPPSALSGAVRKETEPVTPDATSMPSRRMLGTEVASVSGPVEGTLLESQTAKVDEPVTSSEHMAEEAVPTSAPPLEDGHRLPLSTVEAEANHISHNPLDQEVHTSSHTSSHVASASTTHSMSTNISNHQDEAVTSCAQAADLALHAPIDQGISMDTEPSLLNTDTSSKLDHAAHSPSTQISDPNQDALRNIPPGGAMFGTAAPIEIPTSREVELAMDEVGLSTLNRLVSPVFFSTDMASGAIQQGLGGIPECRPLLFVGNHQLFAPDTSVMVAGFLKERGMMLRGLTHPLAMNGFGNGNDQSASTGSFLKTFGGVPVSGANLYKLLSLGEAALLYPGGAREAMKGKGEKYKLFWPKRQEFVRMAARFGATIIPFAAVGAEDAFNLVTDSSDMLRTPILGDLIRRRFASGEGRSRRQARNGVNKIDDPDEAMMFETFLPGLVTFNAPSRFYFVCRRPIQTTPAMASNKSRCDEMYSHVKSEVEAGLEYLLKKRLSDPYADLGPRLLYEAASGGKAQAPTFKP